MVRAYDSTVNRNAFCFCYVAKLMTYAFALNLSFEVPSAVVVCALNILFTQACAHSSTQTHTHTHVATQTHTVYNTVYRIGDHTHMKATG